MEITEIAFLVDGPTEDASLKSWISKHYNKSPHIRRTPGNGVNYTIDTYARNAAPIIIQNLNSKFHAIILIPDFEKRANKTKISLQEFAEQLKTKIISEVCNNSMMTANDLQEKIFICPSDIMFENWIISDIEGIKNCSEIQIEGECGKYDGKNGAVILSGMIKGKKYIKTTDAHRLFKKVRKDIGPQYSPSFQSFISTLDNLLT